MPDKRRTWWVNIGSYAPVAIIGGALLGVVTSGLHWDVRVMLHGALIGLVCFSGAVGGELLLHRWIDAAPKQWWRRALVYFVGGQLGFPIGMLLGIWLIWGVPLSKLEFPRGMGMTVLISGGIGTFVGVAAHGYERMKDRLRVSMVAETELVLAREFQARLLPAQEIAADGYRITSRNLPARFVATSLIMASVKAVLPLVASKGDVDEAMRALNERFVGELPKREFIALALARFDPRTGKVSFANAGLPDPYVVRKNGAVETITVTGPRLPIGLRHAIPYEKTSFTLAEGDALMLFSDGLPEATMKDGDQLGYERLAEIVREARGVDQILERVHAMTTEPLEDDQTIVVLERT